MQERVKGGPITDHDLLFNDLAPEIHTKIEEIGIALGLSSTVLTDELETGKFANQQGSKKAFKMLQLWRDSVGGDKFTYSVLAAALEKHGFLRCAVKYCYIEQSCFTDDSPVFTHPCSPPQSPQRPVFPVVTDTVLLHTKGNLD